MTMPYRKHGINPRLISIATGKSLADIPASPPPSQLPGAYAKLFSPQIEELAELPGRKYMLSCQSCGKKGEYGVGMIAFNAQEYEKAAGKDCNPLDHFQFSGYFRCKHCNSAGSWDYPSHTKQDLMFAIMGSSILSQFKEQSDVVFGKLATYDGKSFTWATETEEYYLDKLQADPRDAWIWNRLGNHYSKGGRPDLAVVAFQQSTHHDPNQFESHFSLGRLLYEARYKQEALVHLRQALKSGREYTKMPPLELREGLAAALQILYAIHRDPQKVVDEIVNLPKGDNFQPSSNVIMLNFQLHFDSAQGLYPLAETLMGHQQDEIPKSEQAISLPKARPVHPKQKKPPKKKSKKR
jgi:tetratricopeptide (TPR) repeat protein